MKTTRTASQKAVSTKSSFMFFSLSLPHRRSSTLSIKQSVFSKILFEGENYFHREDSLAKVSYRFIILVKLLKDVSSTSDLEWWKKPPLLLDKNRLSHSFIHSFFFYMVRFPIAYSSVVASASFSSGLSSPSLWPAASQPCLAMPLHRSTVHRLAHPGRTCPVVPRMFDVFFLPKETKIEQPLATDMWDQPGKFEALNKILKLGLF